MMRNPVTDLPPRIVYLAMGMAVLLMLLASWLYLFKQPLAEYRQLQANHIAYKDKVQEGSGLEVQMSLVNGEVEQLSRRLFENKDPRSVSDLVAQTVDILDRLSQIHEVRLVGLKPGKSRVVPMFKEVPFAVEVQGNYYKLFNWLAQAEHELGPMVVKSFDLRLMPSREVQMKLNLASYQLQVEDL